MLGTPTPLGRLAADAAEYEQRISALVSDDDDLVAYVARLESLDESGLDDDDDDEDDDSVGGELGDGGADRFDEHDVESDDLMAEVERFLRDQPDD